MKIGREGKTDRKFAHLEILVLAIYAVLLIVVIASHEPWYDEAQSWLIARDASWRDILFRLPHYEGHPPFWWILLSVPARLGIPFQIGLQGLEVVFAVLGEYLIIFHSPFPRWIRCILPFTYFLFYQYGVMSRPYSILVCAVCLGAMTWRTRNKKPFRFVGALMLICLTCAYGILIAGGIAVVWCLEIFRKRTLFRNRPRLTALACLLLLALVLLAQIYPYPDTYSAHMPVFHETLSSKKQFLLFFFCLPAETMFTSFARDVHLRSFLPDTGEVVRMALVTIPMWFALIRAGWKRRTWLYLFVPYLIVAVFSSFVYFHTHHLGVLFLIFLFYLWISWDEKQLFANRYAEAIFRAALIAGLLVNLSWTLTGAVTELRTNFSAGREIASLITDKGLQNYRISYSWWIETDDAGEIIYENTHVNRSTVDEVNMYLKKPVLDGYLGGQSYADFRDVPQAEMDREKEELKEAGVDVIIGRVQDVYFSQLGLDPDDFAILPRFYYERAWKNRVSRSSEKVFMRRSLMQELGLKELDE